MMKRFCQLSAGMLFVVLMTACTPQEAPVLPAITAASSLPPAATPTLTAIPPTATEQPVPTDSVVMPTIVPVAAQEATAMVFIGETVPDGANLQPSQAFRKTWTLKNGGQRAWVEGFALATLSSDPAGENLGSPDVIPLAQEVKPGEDVQIGVDLVAPEQEGCYAVTYQLQDETGTPVPDSRIWVTVTIGSVSPPGSVTTGSISAQFVGASMQGGEYNVTFYMQLPDSCAWFPWDVTLVVDQQPISPSGGRSDPTTALTDHKCFTLSYPTDGIELGGAVQLSIGKVELPPEVHQDENSAQAHETLTAAYPGLDFTCSGPGMFYTNLMIPPGLSKEQADKLIIDAMSSAVYGPWVLTIR